MIELLYQNTNAAKSTKQKIARREGKTEKEHKYVDTHRVDCQITIYVVIFIDLHA
jgi:hypothetical protein